MKVMIDGGICLQAPEPEEGTMYRSTDTEELYIYMGGQWVLYGTTLQEAVKVMEMFAEGSCWCFSEKDAEWAIRTAEDFLRTIGKR